MPWRETEPMEQKVLFMADHLRSAYFFTDLCRLYGISRKTGYKWVKRFNQLGLEGLQDRSRKPANCPHRIPFTLREAILRLRKEREYSKTPFGPKKIKALLEQRHPTWDIPSETSIYNILKQEGLIRAQRRCRRVAAPPQKPFSPVREPNDVWSADFKGQFKTRDGTWCFPLTVMDYESRYLLGCRGVTGTTYEQTRRTFDRLFRKYGLPERIRTDNGPPFVSRGAGGLSRLSMWWVKLGIMPERIKPGRPQQNGRHERMHKTLKQETAIPPAANFKQQQNCFDTFRRSYNHERPHEGLGQKPPGVRYRPSLKAMPTKLPELVYPGHFKEALVHSNGIIHHQGYRVYICGLLRKEKVGLEEIGDGIWEVYFGPVRLGQLSMREIKTSRNDYVKLKV